MRVEQGFVSARDGTKIRFQTMGAGQPILCCNGLGVPIYFWRHLCADFADRYQIVCWDYRGHGKSALPPHPYHLRYEDFIDDGLAVVRHLGLRHIIGIGHSAGFQVLLGLYEAEPLLFSALSSFLGTYGKALSFFFDSPVSRAVFDLFYVLAVFYPGSVGAIMQLLGKSSLAFYLGGLLGILNLDEARRQDLQVYFDHVCAMDPRFFATLTQGAEAHNVRDVLPRVTVPSLLIASEHDKFVPLRVAHEMQELMPHAELVVIPDGSHAALMECPHYFNHRLAQFLRTHETKIASLRSQ